MNAHQYFKMCIRLQSRLIEALCEFTVAENLKYIGLFNSCETVQYSNLIDFIVLVLEATLLFIWVRDCAS